MLDIKTPIRFFTGTNTPAGFFGFLDDFYDIAGGWRAYLLKGGPGTGKTRLIRRVFDYMSERGLEIQAIICPSEPNSLDGLVFPKIRACILDADAPHAVEPRCWGAVEQLLNLSGGIETSDILKRAPEILELNARRKTLEARCRRFMGGAASLLSHTRRIAFECTDTDKIQRSAAQIAAREFGAGRGKKGRETRRFLSAVTPEGCVIFHQTLQALCPKIYSIEDEYGVSSRLLINEMRARAIASGCDVITCYCPVFPRDKPDHLLIPSIGIGFTTSNLWHKADFPVFRRIHSARFTDTEKLRQRRQIISFNRRAARELINEAAAVIGEIRDIRGRVEQIYSDASDRSHADTAAERVIAGLEEIIAKK